LLYGGGFDAAMPDSWRVTSTDDGTARQSRQFK